MNDISDIFPELKGYDADPRSRHYICPKRVLWMQGSVYGSGNLLKERSSQITLGESDRQTKS